MSALKWFGIGFGIAALGAAAAYAQYRGTEQPDYELVVSEDAFELRDYGPLVVAEVIHNGSRREASNRSFRRLAAYIFAQDRPSGGEKIAMTAPVLQDRATQDEKIAMTAPVMQDRTADDQWRMRFVMPAKYSLETLPPAPSDITLAEVPARRVAAVRFSGYGRPDELAEMEAALTGWIAEQGLKPVGEVEYAFYDAPVVPGPLRRNEVMIEVAAEL